MLHAGKAAGTDATVSGDSASRYNPLRMLRTHLYADPDKSFLHDLILESCRRFPNKTAMHRHLLRPPLHLRRIRRHWSSAWRADSSPPDSKPGEVVAIFLPNSWEFCAAYHAATLAGGIPTLLNPTYREREVRYQLENSGAAFLITDGATARANQSRRPPQSPPRLHHAPARHRS